MTFSDFLQGLQKVITKFAEKASDTSDKELRKLEKAGLGDSERAENARKMHEKAQEILDKQK